MSKSDHSFRFQQRESVPLKLRRPFGSAMLSEFAWQEIARSLRLTERELQVVRATFDDMKESAIAAELGIKPRTVHTYVERLHVKLAVADRLQLVLCVMHEFIKLTVSSEGKLPPICASLGAGRCPLCG